jgi:hypothetical protein
VLTGAFVLFALVRALGTGRLGFGSAAVVRASDPAQFRYSLGLLAVLAAAAAAMPFDSRFASAALALLAALSLAPYPWRWLRSGEAGWEQAMFSRREEPLQYWPLVVGLILMVLASAALAAATAVQAWELRGS